MKKLFMGLLVLGIFCGGCAVTGIEDGEGGVKADFGKISEEAIGTGWHWYNPLITWIEVWNVKTQEIKETASVPSSEGLISELDVSILFRVPKENIVMVRKTIGHDYISTVVEPYVREAIRNVASGYEVKALYSEAGRSEIGKKIKLFLDEKLVSKGVSVQDVLLRDVRLPQLFTASIQEKLKTEQQALQKQFELQKAERDAEISIARARGIAESNKIIAASLSDSYLRYLWVEGIGKTSEKQIVYVPTEANLPILEAVREAGK